MTVLSTIKRICQEIPEKNAITHHQGRGCRKDITYHDLDIQSDILANHLMSYDIKPGHLVGIYMRRCIEHVISMMAILKSGAAFYSLNPKLSPHQIDYIIDLCQSPFIIMENSGVIKLANSALGQLSQIRLIHFSNENLTSIHHACLNKLAKQTALESIKINATSNISSHHSFPRIIGQDVALSLFTSGSTGLPKGVKISHQDLYNRVVSECRDFRLTRADKLLNLLPFSFDVGLNQLYSALTSGTQLIISNSWLAQDICTAIKEYRITGVSGVPSIWIEMMAYKEDEVRDCFNRLRYFTISGGGMAHSQLKRLRQLAPHTGIYKTYGQTEAFRSGILFPEEFDQKITSVGRPVEGTDVFILNATGRQATTNEVGQIIHCGDGIMLGYVGDPTGTNKKLKKNPLQSNGMIHSQSVVYTGDIGKMDEDGYIYILGRRDKMIKCRGNRVYPQEIQNAILDHDQVLEAAIFSVKDERGESVIHAEVRLKSGSSVSGDILKKFLSQRLPSYMIPLKIIFVKSFPRTSSGKIMLSAIEEKYNDQK